MTPSSECSFWVIEIVLASGGKRMHELVIERKIYLSLSKVSKSGTFLPPLRNPPNWCFNISPRLAKRNKRCQEGRKNHNWNLIRGLEFACYHDTGWELISVCIHKAVNGSFCSACSRSVSKNHTETTLIITPFGWWLRHISNSFLYLKLNNFY